MSDNTQLSLHEDIWRRFNELHIDFEEDETLAGMERFNPKRFYREHNVFRVGHFGTRILSISEKTQLPNGSILHVLDNLNQQASAQDTPRVDDNKFITQEEFRKYIFHIQKPNLDGDIKLKDKFIYRPAGLPSVFMKFRSTYGSKFRYVNSQSMIPRFNESLVVVNHNPLFRVKTIGRLNYFRKMQIILTSILNTTCALIDEFPNKQQFIQLPWDTEVYNKHVFLRSRDQLTMTTIKKPNSFQYILMMHLVNFMWDTATTSIFDQIPSEKLEKINLILTLGDKFIIYNLNDLKTMNEKNRMHLRFVNQLNAFSLMGRDLEKELAKQLIAEIDDEIDLSKSIEEDKVADIHIDKETPAEVDNLYTTDELTLENSVVIESDDASIENTIIDESDIEDIDNKSVSKVKTKIMPDIMPIFKAIEVDEQDEIIATKGILQPNTTVVKSVISDTRDIDHKYLEDLDADTIKFIEDRPELTPGEKNRYKRIATKYKDLQIGGRTISTLMTTDTDISVEESPLDEKKIGYLPDKSALNSSMANFDAAYMQKTFTKQLASVVTSFQKNGVFLVDVKEEKVISEMNNLTLYTMKYEDIKGKQSTVKFRIPTVDKEGRILIDGTKQILKKQRINLPIVKISETEVSLASNQNKYRVERNVNKAHNFFSFVDSMINSPKSTAKIEFSSNKVNLPLSYEYSSLADRYKSVSFTSADKDLVYLYFDYNTRGDIFKGDVKKFIALENTYGTFIGTFNTDLLFVDNQNAIYAVTKDYSENVEYSYNDFISLFKLSLVEPGSFNRSLTEWTSVKIQDSHLPTMFLLSYRYGLRGMLDYMGVNYAITERRTKTIVGESGVTAPLTIATEAYTTEYEDVTIENSKVSELSKEDRVYIEKMEKQLRTDQLKYIANDVNAVWREIGETSEPGLDENSRYTVAKKDDKIIGFTSFSVKNKELLLHQLYVDKKYRGMRLGSRLLDTALKHAKRFHSGMAELRAFYANTTAVDMYKSRGFTVDIIESTCMAKNIKGVSDDDYQVTKGREPILTAHGMAMKLDLVKNKVLVLMPQNAIIADKLNDFVETTKTLGYSFKMVCMIHGDDIDLPKHWNKQTVIMKVNLADVIVAKEDLSDFIDTAPKQSDSDYYYHISLNDLGDEYTFSPRVPGTMIPQQEDSTISRVCVSHSIEGCIIGNPYLFVSPDTAKSDKRFRTRLANCFVYAIPKNEVSAEDIVSNETIVSSKLVFDAHVTDEVWITKDVTLRKIGKIKVNNNSSSSGILFEPLLYRNQAKIAQRYINNNFDRIKYLDEIDELGLEPHEYIIGASACAMMYGYPKESNDDLDICISKVAFDRIADKLTKVEDGDGWSYKHIDLNIDIDTRWFNFKKYTHHTWLMKGYTFLSPWGICKFYDELYNLLGREKHKITRDWVFEEVKAVRTETYLFPHVWTDGPHYEYSGKDNTSVVDTSAINEIFNTATKFFDLENKNFTWQHSEVPIDHNGNVVTSIPAAEFAGCITKDNVVYLNTPENMVTTMKTWGIQNKFTLMEFYNHIIAHELAHAVWRNMSDKERQKVVGNIPDNFTTEYLDSYPKNHPKYESEKYCEWNAVLFVDTQKRKESSSAPKYFYHISHIDQGDSHVFIPRVPEYLSGNYEDNKIERVSVSELIEGCIIGNPYTAAQPRKDEFYVYVIPVEDIKDKDIVYNTLIMNQNLVSDARLTKESWITSEITMRKMGKIKLIIEDESVDFFTELVKDESAVLSDFLTYTWTETSSVSLMRETGHYSTPGKDDTELKMAAVREFEYGVMKKLNNTITSSREAQHVSDMEILTPVISDVKRYVPKPSDIQIKFKDRTLWINRYPLAHSLVVAGLEAFDLSKYEMAEFEGKDIYYQLLTDKRMSINVIKGIDSFFDLFMDPMTYTTLEMMNEPTNVRDLLLRCALLLSTLDHLPASSSANHRIRGYEQFNAIIYNEMARQFASYQTRRGKANSFSINPDAVFLRIIQNASMVPVESVNPLQDMKESAQMTYSGVGGRSAESFVVNDRKYAKDDIGILSEATPDNHKVGINAQLSLDPSIKNTMGILKSKPLDELEPANLLSIHGLVFPFSNHDDSKRQNFISIQSTHMVPTKTADRARVKTGYEKIVAHRVGRTFAGVATSKGKVTDIDEKTNMIEVTYDDGTTDVFSYGESYVEFQGFQVTQNIANNVKLGQTVSNGDIITYNTGYFNKDFQTGQVEFSTGVLANVALMEADSTLEDSTEISQRLSSKMGMIPTNTRVITLSRKSAIYHKVNIGDHVQHTDPLLIFEEEPMEGSSMFNTDEHTLQMLGELNRKTPTAKFSGKIVKIDAFYGGPINEMHPTLGNIVKSAVELKNKRSKIASGTDRSEDFPPSGIMPRGSKYKGVMFDEDTVCLVFYIQEDINLATGDKLVFMNQLKCTCAGVFPQKIQTESGVEIDAFFSPDAVTRRVVLSPTLYGIIARVMEKVEDNAIDMYFNEK